MLLLLQADPAVVKQPCHLLVALFHLPIGEALHLVLPCHQCITSIDVQLKFLSAVWGQPWGRTSQCHSKVSLQVFKLRWVCLLHRSGEGQVLGSNGDGAQPHYCAIIEEHTVPILQVCLLLRHPLLPQPQLWQQQSPSGPAVVGTRGRAGLPLPLHPGRLAAASTTAPSDS